MVQRQVLLAQMLARVEPGESQAVAVEEAAERVLEQEVSLA